MPSTPRPSKQRRAAENRAQRQALAARRENAQRTPTPSTQSGGSSGSTREQPPRRGLLGSLFSPPAGGQQRPNRPDPNALPPDDGAGRRALLIALVLAGLATVALAFLPVPVDSEGEPLSRDELDELNDNDESYDSDPGFSAIGPLVFVSGLPTIVAAGFALRGLTRPRRSRTLMICLLMAAVAVLLTAGGGLLFLPATAAIAVAHFQVRKADLAAAAAAGGSAPAASRGEVIEADVVDDDVIDADVVDEDQRKD